MTDNIKPEGDNVIEMPANELKDKQEKIMLAMNDERLQQFASAIILGNQLYAWGVMFLSHEPGHDEEILATMINAIQMSMIDHNGVPRPFAEEDLLSNLNDIIPFMTDEIKRHGEQREAINKLTDKMIAEAANKEKSEQAETEETRNNE